jgi:hypothetical protein
MEIKQTPASVHFDQMGWPKPNPDLEWTLRYGEPNKNQLLLAAWIVQAYGDLITVKNQKDRNYICGVIKQASAPVSAKEG